jgi:hypothetical protein
MPPLVAGHFCRLCLNWTHSAERVALMTVRLSNKFDPTVKAKRTLSADEFPALQLSWPSGAQSLCNSSLDFLGGRIEQSPQ